MIKRDKTITMRDNRSTRSFSTVDRGYFRKQLKNSDFRTCFVMDINLSRLEAEWIIEINVFSASKNPGEIKIKKTSLSFMLIVISRLFLELSVEDTYARERQLTKENVIYFEMSRSRSVHVQSGEKRRCLPSFIHPC